MRRGLVGLAVLVLLVLFTGLGSVGYFDVREARDQAVARELIDRREPFTPVLGGAPLLDKPTLGYAIDLACALTTDGDPRTPRTVKALGIVALAFVTGWLAARRFGTRTGLLSAGVFLTCVGPVVAARYDGTQVMAGLLGWIACAAFAGPVLTGSGRARVLLVGWAALGFALVIAGPLPALWPVAGVLLFLVLGRGGTFAALQPVAGITLALAIALPWYAASFERHGRDLVVAMFAFPYAANPRGSWLRAPIDAFVSLIAAGFPWSAMLPFATLHARAWWRSRRPADGAAAGASDPSFVVTVVEEQVQDESASHLVIAWLIAAFVPLLFYPHPPLSAALPALPALAILCGRVLDHLFEVPRRVAVIVNGAARVLAPIGAAAALFITLVANQLPDGGHPLPLLAAVLLVTSCAPALAGFIRRPRIAALLFAAPLLLGAPITTVLVLPALEAYFNARAVVARLEQEAPRGASLVVIEPPPPSLRIDLDHNLVRTPLDREAILEWRAADGAAYFAYRPVRERSVIAALGTTPEVLVRTAVLVLARVR